MSRPHWSIHKTPRGKWIVRQPGVTKLRAFDRWSVAVTFIKGRISQAAVAAVISRAEESGEYEAIPAYIIDAPDIHRKRRRVVQAAWWRGLSAKVEFELEDDPRDSLLLLKVRRERAS
jgi:hypothetical protein